MSIAEQKNCQNCKKEFTIEPEDFEFYKKIEVPPPTWCPRCRMIRRMYFWNERFLFKKREKRTGKDLFSQYPPESEVEIYDRDYWWSDAWDPLEYGMEIDWSRPFLTQLRELQLKVPMAARSIVRSVNSDYSNNAADIKNCYLVFNADRCEDCMYLTGVADIRNSIAAFRSSESENVYEAWANFKSYQCFFSSVTMDSRNLWFCYDCHNSSDCFGCVNLRNKKYCIFNEQYTKEEYQKKLAAMNLGSHQALTELQKKFEEFSLKFPRRFMAGLRNVNCTGDGMHDCKNVHLGFGMTGAEDVRYSQSLLLGAKDSSDYTNWGNNAELMYEAESCGENAQRIKFSYECYGGVSDIEYSMTCIGSSNLFGCVGLRNKKYCILNKEYSKEEYEALLPKLKKHMEEMPYVDAKGRVFKYGEFFPTEFSWNAVNESAILDFADFSKEEAKEYGLLWRAAKPNEHTITKKAEELPDHINDTPEDITKEVIGCQQCGRGYRILPAELQFLKRFGLPLARSCPTCRMRNLVARRKYPVWYNRICQCAGARSENGVYKNTAVHDHGEEHCSKQFVSAYAKDHLGFVYCEACYNKEVV